MSDFQLRKRAHKHFYLHYLLQIYILLYISISRQQSARCTYSCNVMLCTK